VQEPDTHSAAAAAAAQRCLTGTQCSVDTWHAAGQSAIAPTVSSKVGDSTLMMPDSLYSAYQS